MLMLGITLFIGSTTVAQKSRNFKGNKRSDFFGGAQDYRDITKHGLQISFGPNYTLTKGKNDEYLYEIEVGRPIKEIIDPAGCLGAFINIGMAHYRLKESRFWGGLAKKNSDGFFGRRVKSNLFHRFDWGLGFDYIGGRETTTVELYNPFNELVSSEETKGSF